MATYYEASRFDGRPLYCDQWSEGRLVYDEGAEPWIALDEGAYLSGAVECGDRFLLVFEDGSYLVARAHDAGWFGGFEMAGYPGMPLVVDVPEHLHPNGGTILVSAYNLTRWGVCPMR